MGAADSRGHSRLDRRTLLSTLVINGTASRGGILCLF